MKMTGAQILVKELIQHGTDIIFGYPGGYVLDIYDELYKNKDKIRHILTAGEQGAAFAADAYARVSGKTTAVLATGGPGATNLVTGIANSYLDSVPVVYITGNVAVPMLGQDSFQDIDIVGVTMPIVKHSYVVKDIGDLQHCIREAFLIAGSGRKGPVHIDIPKDVQLGEFHYNPELKLTAPSGPPDLSAINDAARLIKESKKPIIYCGGGVSATATGTDIMKLSEKLGAPVCMSLMGLGSVPHSFKLNLGMSGMHGRYASIMAMNEADLIIAAGVRFSDRATGSARRYAKNTKVIHMDADAAEIGKNIQPDVSIKGDLRDTLPALLSALEGVAYITDKDWPKRVCELKRIEKQKQDENDRKIGDILTPRRIIECVNSHFGDDTVVTTDVGQHQMWVAQNYRFEKPHTLVTSGGLGSMGYGLGAAIGASLALGGKQVVHFTGDGSFGMNMQELATAAALNLPITTILINNNSLGMVRQQQTVYFGKRYSNSDIVRKTDFPALARAFGADGCRAASPNQLKNALENAPADNPYLIECIIDSDEMVLPMIPAGAGIDKMII